MHCPECGAAWTDGQTCQDFFHQFLFWENEDPARGEVHHLMVLCYHLQHPSLYSAEGLAHARGLLSDFVERGLSTEEVRRRQREAVASSNRQFSVTARSGNQGAYERPVTWTMTAADVAAGGAKRYCENVRAWSDSVFRAINDQP
jgi:hypothetical protein